VGDTMKQELEVVRGGIRQLAWRAVAPGFAHTSASDLLVRTLSALDAIEMEYEDLLAEVQAFRLRTERAENAAEYNVVDDRAQLAALGEKP